MVQLRMRAIVKTEVIIAERNEWDLQATIDSIREHNDCSVRVVSDHEGRGPQAMRHQGIMESDADVVIIMDGHMRSLERRLDAAADYVGKRGNKVACLKCFHSPEVSWNGKMYGGAKLVWKSNGRSDGKDPQAFVAKWREDADTTGKIGCVMGACYVFRRDWYIDGLREPWKHGTGWGCDEEIISAATWLRGGEVELLPWAVWHRARKEGGQPFRYTQRQLFGLYANRLRLLQVLPMPQKQRNDLLRHLMGGLSSGRWVKIAKICDESAEWQEQYRAFLGAGGLSWDEFSRKVMEKETVKMPSLMELREQAREAGIKVPRGCKKADLERMLEDYVKGNKKAAQAVYTGHEDDCVCGGCAGLGNEPPKPPKTRANWGVNELNGRKSRGCPHCGGGNTTTVRTRPKAGRSQIRDRKCLSCGRNFTTREVDPL